MSKTTRRDFMRTTAAATAGVAATRLNVLQPGRVLGANSRVRVALVGASDRTMSSLLPAFQTYAKELNFELVAVCDIWKKRREEVPGKIAQKYVIASPAGVRNTDELYDRKDVDAVIIGTADFQHAFHAIEAVKAGKDVYAEKPFANIM
ncbi:MAG: Gfo/Idh/MocA family protein, partial [Acidobacteriota bacterium]